MKHLSNTVLLWSKRIYFYVTLVYSLLFIIFADSFMECGFIPFLLMLLSVVILLYGLYSLFKSSTNREKLRFTGLYALEKLLQKLDNDN